MRRAIRSTSEGVDSQATTCRSAKRWLVWGALTLCATPCLAGVTQSGDKLTITGNTSATETFTIVGTGNGSGTVTHVGGVTPFSGVRHVSFDGGPGREVFDAQALDIDGNLDVYTRDGTSTVRVRALSDIGGKTTILANGGNDVVRINNVALAGDVYVHTGTGLGDIEVARTSTGANVWLQTGNNNDDIITIQNGCDFFNDVMVITGHGTSQVTISDDVLIGRNLMIQGGAQADTVDIFGEVGIAGNFAVYTYEAFDIVSISDGFLVGHDFLVSTGSGGDEIYLYTSLIGGFTTVFDIGNNALIDSGIDSDLVEVNAATEVADLHVGGDTRLQTYAGEDDVFVSFCDLEGNLFVNLGDHNDDASISLIEVGGNTNAFLGNGDDDLDVSLSTFDGSVFVDGGPGSDSLTETGNTYNGGPPQVNNVP
jgi:hypothetical protein